MDITQHNFEDISSGYSYDEDLARDNKSRLKLFLGSTGIGSGVAAFGLEQVATGNLDTGIALVVGGLAAAVPSVLMARKAVNDFLFYRIRAIHRRTSAL